MISHSAGQLAQIACLIEATSRKPGNVHRFRDFDDTHYLDFLLSAGAIAGPLDRAVEEGVGRTVLDAIIATRSVVQSNTNLGMVLLLAPMAAVPIDRPLRAGLADILARLTVEDASLVYKAIRLAQAGGLGQAEDQDVAGTPTVTLLEAMRLAADRDRVAHQYVTDYSDIFERILPCLQTSIRSGVPIETAVITAFLEFLGDEPDTLIVRKRGSEVAREVSRRSRQVLFEGWPDRPGPLEAFDTWLRIDGHARNPGATADLTTAALFAALRDGTIALPLVKF